MGRIFYVGHLACGREKGSLILFLITKHLGFFCTAKIILSSYSFLLAWLLRSCLHEELWMCIEGFSCGVMSEAVIKINILVLHIL